MIVSLIGRNNIYKVTLPQTPVGNYWITDNNGENEKKLLNIEGQGGHWQVTSTQNARIVNPKSFNPNNIIIEGINQITLKEYSTHYILLGDSNDLFVLYCAPVYEDNFIHLNIGNTSELLIGSSQSNDIIYRNPLVKDTQARIFFYNGRCMIENYDFQFGTFVNDIPLFTEPMTLSNGDTIYIMGLKIVVMGKSIFINNPLNKVSYRGENLAINNIQNNLSNLTKENEEDTELYRVEDYFSRAPRITNLIEKERVKIDPPPNKQDREAMPLILMLGSTLSMGVMMMVSVMNSIEGAMKGTATAKETVFAIIIALAMLASMILIPILTRRYEKQQKIKYEEKRQKKYTEYLYSKSNQIDEIMNKQREILFENYAAPEECAKIILSRNSRLWERKIEDNDFLSVRVGIGDIPLNIDVQYPEEKFTMDDDNLMEILNKIGEKSKTLKNAPITLSLVEKNVSALVVQNNQKLIEKFMQGLIMQLIAFNSYEDLKLVFLVDEDKQKKWEYVKMLPHLWNNTREIRFFADNLNDMKEVSRYIEEEIKARSSYGDKVDYRSFMPYYLIITDDYKKIENLKMITEILKSKVNIGFSILCITNNLMQLPNECKTFISLDNEVGTIFQSEMSSTSKQQFTFDISQIFFFDKIEKVLSNIPIKYTAGSRKNVIT